MDEVHEGLVPVTYYTTSARFGSGIRRYGLVPDARLPIARAYDGPERDRVGRRALMALPGPLFRVWRGRGRQASERADRLAKRLVEDARSERADVLELELRLEPRHTSAMVFDRWLYERSRTGFACIDEHLERWNAREYWENRKRLDRSYAHFTIPEVAVFEPVPPERISVSAHWKL